MLLKLDPKRHDCPLVVRHSITHKSNPSVLAERTCEINQKMVSGILVLIILIFPISLVLISDLMDSKCRPWLQMTFLSSGRKCRYVVHLYVGGIKLLKEVIIASPLTVNDVRGANQNKDAVKGRLIPPQLNAQNVPTVKSDACHSKKKLCGYTAI